MGFNHFADEGIFKKWHEETGILDLFLADVHHNIMIIRMKYNFYQIGHANRMLYNKEYLDTGSFAESKI